MPPETETLKGFHAHVYFDAGTVERARAVCEAARDRFAIAMGRMHERPVGPHPMWSCQLAFPPDKAGAVFSWLALNRRDLIVFAHALTGDDLKDHTDHAIWMGGMLELDLSVLE